MHEKLSRFLRLKRGELSLREFAHMCDDISHTAILTLEKGFDPRTGNVARPTVETLERIAKGIGVPTFYLAGLAAGEDPPLQEILTSAQKELLAAFESLDAVGCENVMRAIRFELFRISEENEYAEKKTGTDPDGLA